MCHFPSWKLKGFSTAGNSIRLNCVKGPRLWQIAVLLLLMAALAHAVLPNAYGMALQQGKCSPQTRVLQLFPAPVRSSTRNTCLDHPLSSAAKHKHWFWEAFSSLQETGGTSFGLLPLWVYLWMSTGLLWPQLLWHEMECNHGLP